MKQAMAVILIGLALSVLLSINSHHLRYTAGKRTEYCWPFCAQQGPKPNATQGQPCQACVVESPIDWAPINARMAALHHEHHVAHAGGTME